MELVFGTYWHSASIKHQIRPANAVWILFGTFYKSSSLNSFSCCQLFVAHCKCKNVLNQLLCEGISHFSFPDLSNHNGSCPFKAQESIQRSVPVSFQAWPGFYWRIRTLNPLFCQRFVALLLFVFVAVSHTNHPALFSDIFQITVLSNRV